MVQTRSKKAGLRANGYTNVMERPPVLIKAVPIDWLWLPKPLRLILGWALLIWFTLLFFSIPSFFLLLIPYFWRGNMFYFSSAYLVAGIVSLLIPEYELVWFRKIFQLWYEIIDFKCNLNENDLGYITGYGEEAKTDRRLVTCMHPHGIVPYAAAIWAAYCDQYLPDLYGFGATADVVLYIPFLRNVISGLSAGRAGFRVCYDALVHGIAPCCNNAGRKPKHMFVLPGGIAEVFQSTPGTDRIVFKSRRGLCKLAVKTGAELCPAYVFGGNDFLYNFAAGNSPIAKFSRKLKTGLTLFYGQLGLPFVPFAPKCSLCLGPPLKVPPETTASGAKRTEEERIEELHDAYMSAITELFEHYKVEAGYPNAKLEIV